MLNFYLEYINIIGLYPGNSLNIRITETYRCKLKLLGFVKIISYFAISRFKQTIITFGGRSDTGGYRSDRFTGINRVILIIREQ